MLATVTDEGRNAAEGPDVRREAVLLVVIPHLRKGNNYQMCLHVVVIISKQGVDWTVLLTAL